MDAENSNSHHTMANSESSFADRLQRGVTLHAAIAGFTPIFAPADPAVEPAAFNTFLESLGTMNQGVALAEAEWKVGAANRSALVAEIKARALRANARVKSNSAWKARQAAVKTAAANLRGYRTPPPKVPADPEAGTPAPASRAKRDQSYGDIKNLLDKLVAALNQVPQYDTGSPVEITTASLAALSTQLDGLNQTVAGMEQALAAVRVPRSAAYNTDQPGSPCLRSRMLAAKEAAKSQYGSTSMEYAQVKGIKV